MEFVQFLIETVVLFRPIPICSNTYQLCNPHLRITNFKEFLSSYLKV